ncbi:MAG TPA: hypothetical protein VGQ09_18870 [Chitinophagaceae bacterium]|jgi:hypothetical protein|nr:hypothetical protein [Chitinophagaceae bacterium]
MNHFSAKAARLGGTIFSIFTSICWVDIQKTIVLSAVGTAVSFVVTALLQMALKKRKK